MNYGRDLSFLYALDPSTLSDELRQKRNEYWASRTHGERLEELQRIRTAIYGDAANAPIKKVIEIIKRVL